MGQYKVYLVKDKHIVAPATLIEADCDPAAVEYANKLACQYDVELWLDTRLIQTFPAKANGK